MKRTFTFSLALVLSIVVLSLMRSDSTVNADPTRTYIADTGMITLGPNQFLRVTVTPSLADGRYRLTVLAAQITVNGCSGGVCTHIVTSQTTTAPVTLLRGQAASHDIVPTPGSTAVRGRVIGDSPNVQVNALIIDSNTGSTVAFVGGVRVAAGDIGGDN